MGEPALFCTNTSTPLTFLAPSTHKCLALWRSDMDLEQPRKQPGRTALKALGT